MGPDLLDGDVEITELEALEVESIKGVAQGASGFPILMMKGLPGEPPAAPEPEPAAKSGPPPDWHAGAARLAKLGATAGPGFTAATLLKAVAADGTVNEQPDIDGGKQAIALIAKLIGYEAQELAAGELDETTDIGLLNEAICCLKYWLSREQASQAGADAYGDDGVMDGMVMASVDEPFTYGPDEVAKDSREFSAAERKKHAAAGNALPDGSYPIPDVDALRRAAILARSKHGNWQAAKRLIARRAKELGVANPLTEEKADASKSTQIAEGEADVDTEAQGTGGLSKAVEDAVTKALAPIQGELEALRVFKAKVEALPVPGGPVMSITTAPSGAGDAKAELVRKAAYYREWAERHTDPATAESYRQAARNAETQAAQTA